jgi:hypothetical protein
MLAMSKHKPQDAKPAKPPILYLRLLPSDEAALQDYIHAQDTPPDRTAVGLRALRAFLRERGYLKDPAKPKP